MYVAVKGGEKAIAAAHRLQEHRRRGDDQLPELSVAQGDRIATRVEDLLLEEIDLMRRVFVHYHPVRPGVGKAAPDPQ